MTKTVFRYPKVMLMMHLQKLGNVVDDGEEDYGDNVEETVENLSQSEFAKENLLSNFNLYQWIRQD